jgi:hypothetical protein
MTAARTPETPHSTSHCISRGIHLSLSAAIHGESPIAQTPAVNNSRVRVPGAPQCAI